MQYIRFVFGWCSQRNIEFVRLFEWNCLKIVNTRITADTIFEQLRDCPHLFLQIERFNKIDRNLYNIRNIVYLALPWSRCVSIPSFYSPCSFIFSPLSPSFFFQYFFCFIFYKQSSLVLYLFLSRTHTHTTHISKPPRYTDTRMRLVSSLVIAY